MFKLFLTLENTISHFEFSFFLQFQYSVWSFSWLLGFHEDSHAWQDICCELTKYNKFLENLLELREEKF